MANCILKYMEKTSLSGVLPGLDVSGPVVRPMAKDFSCCDSTGMSFGEDGESVLRCGLLSRVQAVQRLLGRFEQTWGREWLPQLFEQTVSDEVLLWLKAYKQDEGSSFKGQCIKGQRSSGPSVLWAIALAAAWRFGLRSHMVTLGKSKPQDYFPPDALGDNPAKLIYFVESVDRLWTPEKSFEFETLVGWCDRSEVPLWVEFLLDKKQGVATSKRDKKDQNIMRTKFTEKIAAQKNKAPLDWVQSDCLSRLGMVSEGVSKFQGTL